MNNSFDQSDLGFVNLTENELQQYEGGSAVLFFLLGAALGFALIWGALKED